jgi:hypothetical protein
MPVLAAVDETIIATAIDGIVIETAPVKLGVN